MESVESESKNKKRPASSDDSDGEPETKKLASDDNKDKKGWDVEEVRGDHESVEHWELRKEFLVQNMDRGYTKNRLICLSQVFANVEFLGCRYPEETMELVHELSLGIVEAYREKQKTRLQRTFVKASDAAERKTKGWNSKSAEITKGDIDSKSIKTESDHSNRLSEHSISEQISSTLFSRSLLQNSSDFNEMILLIYSYTNGESPIQIIHRSCNASKIPIMFEFQGTSGNYTCTYTIGKNFIMSNNGHASKDTAKGQAAKFAFHRIQKLCYTFVTKAKDTWDNEIGIGKDAIDGKNQTLPEGIPDNNVGLKLLKLMGWTGGGLGKKEQGIHKAISVDGVVGRNGLGLDSSTGLDAFRSKLKNFLREQKESGCFRDLKFSSEFSKEERKEIHSISQILGLKSKSYGKEADRFLVVSEKTTKQSLLKETLAEGGETDKYLVIPPGGSTEKIKQFLY